MVIYEYAKNESAKDNSTKIMKVAVIFICWMCVLSTALIAEHPPTARPTALENLQPLVGVWDVKATCWFTSGSKPFEGQGVERVYWSRNRQFLISDQWMLLPAGWLPKIVTTSWNPLTNEFRLTNILPNATYVATMRAGDLMTTTLEESKSGEHVTRTWTTIEQISPRERRFRSECSIDRGPKWLFAEGVSVKRRAVSEGGDPGEGE